MTKKPYVVIIESKNGTIYSTRFVTKEAASTAAEFWGLRGAAAAVIEDQIKPLQHEE